MSASVDNLALIVLAAGKGTRMRSQKPKVLHPVAGRPMLDWVLATGQALDPSKLVIVIGPELEAMAERFAPHTVVVQRERKGTGHAVDQARGSLQEFRGHALIMFGDTPLATADSMRRMLAPAASGASVVLGVFERNDGAEYGRVVLDDTGAPARIVERKDASPEEREITTLNGGLMVIELPLLWTLLDQIDNKNAQGEYYLTDVLELAYAAGHKTALARLDETELQGVNNRVELAKVEAVAQGRLREQAMLGGASMIDPGTVTLSFDTKLGEDVTVEPNVFFGPGVSVDRGARICANSHLEQTVVSVGCTVGPFARLRPGTVLRAGAKVGNFVEVKNADLGEGSKANHLSYVGDAIVGAQSNIGAGTITCNYDGFNKARTNLGAGVFVGSNTALVAPVTVENGAIIAAGSVITNDVPADSLAVARSRQVNKSGMATKFRRKAKAIKDSGKE